MTTFVLIAAAMLAAACAWVLVPLLTRRNVASIDRESSNLAVLRDQRAELAVDLRRQVREQIAAGKSDDEIITYMTDRYGDFVLYRPPVKATTVLLWGGPALLLLIGAFMLMRIMRERRTAPEAPPLTAEERARADALLASPTKKDPA